MNEYIIYTADGYTSGPNTDIDIENCQVLGTIEGRSEDDAINRLFEQNQWIHKAGFNIDNAIARQLVNSQIKECINIVVDYLWTYEHKHFQENHYPKEHIFRILKRLKDL